MDPNGVVVLGHPDPKEVIFDDFLPSLEKYQPKKGLAANVGTIGTGDFELT